MKNWVNSSKGVKYGSNVWVSRGKIGVEKNMGRRVKSISMGE